MLLAYIDESGTSYKIDASNFFIDGSHAIWGALLVPDNKYFHIERMFYDLFRDILDVSDWRKKELHACDIWNRSGEFTGISKQRATKYFEELIQLITKLKLNVVIGVQQKSSRKKKSSGQLTELRNGMEAFLSALEHKLSELEETAVLIADETSERKDKTQYELLQRLMYKRTAWRYNPGANVGQRGKLRFKYETRSCFLLDQIYYTSSQHSIFIQLSDHINFIIRRVLTYEYLKHFRKGKQPEAVLDKVPVSKESFDFYSKHISTAWYDKKLKDAIFTSDLFSAKTSDFVSKNLFKDTCEWANKKKQSS